MGSRPSRDAEGWGAYDLVTGLNKVMQRIDQRPTLRPLHDLREEIGPKVFQAIDWNRPSPVTGDTVLMYYLKGGPVLPVHDEDCANLIPFMTDEALNHRNKQGLTALDYAIRSNRERTLLILLMRLPGLEFHWGHASFYNHNCGRIAVMYEVATIWTCSYRKAVRAHLTTEMSTALGFCFSTKGSLGLAATATPARSAANKNLTAVGLADIIVSFLWVADTPSMEFEAWLSKAVAFAFIQVSPPEISLPLANPPVAVKESKTSLELGPTVQNLHRALVSAQFQFWLSQGVCDYELATRYSGLLDCRQNYNKHHRPSNDLAFTMDLAAYHNEPAKILSVVKTAGGATLAHLRECPKGYPSALMIAMTHWAWLDWLKHLQISLEMLNGFSRQEAGYMISNARSRRKRWSVCDEQLSSVVIPLMSMKQLTALDSKRRSLFALAVQNLLPNSVQKLVELKVPVPEPRHVLEEYALQGYERFLNLGVPFQKVTDCMYTIRVVFARVNFVTPSTVSPSAISVTTSTKP